MVMYKPLSDTLSQLEASIYRDVRVRDVTNNKEEPRNVFSNLNLFWFVPIVRDLKRFLFIADKERVDAL